jgi:hypothetical protein
MNCFCWVTEMLTRPPIRESRRSVTPPARRRQARAFV